MVPSPELVAALQNVSPLTCGLVLVRYGVDLFWSQRPNILLRYITFLPHASGPTGTWYGLPSLANNELLAQVEIMQILRLKCDTGWKTKRRTPVTTASSEAGK